MPFGILPASGLRLPRARGYVLSWIPVRYPVGYQFDTQFETPVGNLTAIVFSIWEARAFL